MITTRSVRVALAIVFAASIALLSACGEEDGGSDDTFTIGVATAQTGAIAPFDKPAVDGLEVAVEQINEDGGLDGEHPVELELKNTRSDRLKRLPQPKNSSMAAQTC